MASTLFVDGVTASAAAWANDVDTVAYSYLTSVAGTNTVTATGPTSMTAYAAGQMFKLVPAVTNTGATTLNVNSIGAKNVYSGGAACIGSELVASVPALVLYDGTQFNIVSGPAYVQSTWTPVLKLGGATTGITYGTQVARYTRIGRVVTVSGIITLTSKGSATGAATITGLPYVVGSYAPCGTRFNALSTTFANGAQCIFESSQSYINLQFLNGTSVANITDTYLSDTSDIIFGGSYTI